jgi:hypothetical protein
VPLLRQVRPSVREWGPLRLPSPARPAILGDMTTNRANLRAWALLTVSIAAVICIVEYASDSRSGWVRGYWAWARFGFAQFSETARSLIAVVLTLLLGSGLVAGAIQTGLRRCGLRWDSGPDPSQAIDYDDKPSLN